MVQRVHRLARATSHDASVPKHRPMADRVHHVATGHRPDPVRACQRAARPFALAGSPPVNVNRTKSPECVTRNVPIVRVPLLSE